MMKKLCVISLAILASFGAGLAYSDVPNGSSPVTITLTGDVAQELVDNDYWTYSGQANISCDVDGSTNVSVCVLQLPGSRTN